MSDSSIPVDLFNPGQVFACLGFLEAAEVLLGDAEGGFDWSGYGNVKFRLKANGRENPFHVAIQHFLKSDISSLAPRDSELSTAKWNIPSTTPSPSDVFPYPLPSSPATLPAVLSSPLGRITIDHWADSATNTGRDNVKFWAGAGGYPGAAVCRDAINLVLADKSAALADPFSLSAPQSSSFRFDWRRDYIAIDAGFAPNAHEHIVMLGYPLVELFAALGLANARPKRVSKLEYRYGIIGTGKIDSKHRTFDAAFLRASLGGESLGFPSRHFLMQLGWPGQKNQARCITTVKEESTP